MGITKLGQQNNVRIIAGKWRSRKIQFPDSGGLRPTADRIRETLFNWLQLDIVGEDCLDLFAGSGACSIEALSRGAASVLMMDNSAGAVKSLLMNLRALQADNFTVLNIDAMAWLREQSVNSPGRFGIAFIDPPYAAGLALDACHLLEQKRLLKPSARVYIELDSKLDSQQLPANWQIMREKKSGQVYYYLCIRKPEHSFD